MFCRYPAIAKAYCTAGASALLAVQLADPQGSWLVSQEAMRPPWFVVEPKSAKRAATARYIVVLMLPSPVVRYYEAIYRQPCHPSHVNLRQWWPLTITRVSHILLAQRSSGSQRQKSNDTESSLRR